jgi:transglutaminase-like putative cysteine protease
MLVVQPPVRLQHYRDDFLNHVHWFEISEPHDYISITSTLRIRTTNPYETGPPADGEIVRLPGLVGDVMRPFLGGSAYVETTSSVWREALDIKGDRAGVFETATAIMGHIHATWTYDTRVTHAATHMREAMANKSGVCQDYAHVMIGYCRSLGIPARYVSGYLYSGPQGALRGVQASHAWCEVWVPDHGWCGLDPTNGIVADDRFIKIATGRDYADAAPVTGHFNGPSNATLRLEVSVDIERLDP